MGVASKGHYVSVSEWYVYRATMEEIRAGDGVLNDRKPPGCTKGSGLREESCTNKMVVHSRKRAMEICEGLKGCEDD